MHFLSGRRTRMLVSGLAVVLSCTLAHAQRPTDQPDASRILHRLTTLNTLGSVLYIAAHPDDENTRLIAWLANGKHFRTGYLSLTRGDGGQNLIGNEQGDALGIIRTQELLEARRIDGGEQFFTRAVDFGFSKNAAESFAKWGKQEILSDVVRVIRTFRPDVIITRFPPTREAGHGHHEASALLALEAFDLAGDPTAFPEQLEQGLQVWRPKRLFFNGSTWWRKDLAAVAKADPLWSQVDVGGYDPLLGLSYTEIAGRSRSMHKSQGFGAEQRRGETIEFLHFEKGERPLGPDPFEGIGTGWDRVVGGAAIGTGLDRLIASYDLRAPERSIPALVHVRAAIAALAPSTWRERASALADDLLLDLSGTVVEAMAPTTDVVVGDSLAVKVTALTRSPADVGFRIPALAMDTVVRLTNAGHSVRVPLRAPKYIDQPYWLMLPHGDRYEITDPALIGKPVAPNGLAVDVELTFDGGVVVQRRVPVLYRWVDRVKGEQVRACTVVPPLSVYAAPQVVMVHDSSAVAHIGIEAFTDLASSELVSELVADWDMLPQRQDLGTLHPDEHRGAELALRPAAGTTRRTEPVLRVRNPHAGPDDLTRRLIQYDHILPQTWYTPASLRAVPLNVHVDAHRVGYIKGAGDDVPTALKQLGLVVETVDPSAPGTVAELGRFDAIVMGIRAYNTVKALHYLNDSLLAYVAGGGTLVVQYNTNGDDLVLDAEHIGPYPFKITRDRVTVEEAVPTFLAPDDPLLNTPNAITAADFEGWVQERGLYFLGELDPHYRPLIAWSDPGEQPLNGALVACDHGKGRFIYTGISFFRQLPAGVPGAYRLFANLISKRRP